jgi:hypothetical protein
MRHRTSSNQEEAASHNPDPILSEKIATGSDKPIQKQPIVSSELESGMAKDSIVQSRSSRVLAPGAELSSTISQQAQPHELSGTDSVALQLAGSPIYEIGQTNPLHEMESRSPTSPTETRSAIASMTISSDARIEDGNKVFVSQTNPDECPPSSDAPVGPLHVSNQASNIAKIQEIEAARTRLQDRRRRLLELQQVDGMRRDLINSSLN